MNSSSEAESHRADMLSKTTTLIVSLLLFQPLVSAQLSTNTQVNGAVTDESGDVVPDAKVIAINGVTQFMGSVIYFSDGDRALEYRAK